MSSKDKQSPIEIESEIERTRAHMDDTIDAIQGKFSTGELIDQALGYLREARDGPAEFASNLGNTAKQNPVPVRLAGLGLGWLMYSSNRSPERTSLPVKASPDTDNASGVRDRMGNAKHRAADMAESSRQRAGRVAHGTQERIGRISHGTRSSMSSVSHGTEKAGRQTADFMREQPLVAGALGIAFGATLGALLAPSRLEDDVMGEASDDARETAAEAAERQIDKAESAAFADNPSGREKARTGDGHAGADSASASPARAGTASGTAAPNPDAPGRRL